MAQEACSIVGGELGGSEFVSMGWGSSESDAHWTVRGFGPLWLLGGSAISAG